MVFHSTGHPNLDEIGSLRTKRCQQTYRKRLCEKNSSNVANKEAAIPRPREGENFLEVAEFIVEHEIKSETELLAVANKQSEERKKYLAYFVLSHNSKGLHDLIEQTWKMKAASATLQRKKLHE
ncbi:Hypothetical predicted protein [Paramuricea clavata]|uniref:Uncharacterized protein n=1 Tax=Paramuricea clavata TaxID=317549 RepID=A0A6S7IMD7_PARCT|nr:Hypothetical predicted protein [Paramuricea clavata]